MNSILLQSHKHPMGAGISKVNPHFFFVLPSGKCHKKEHKGHQKRWTQSLSTCDMCQHECLCCPQEWCSWEADLGKWWPTNPHAYSVWLASSWILCDSGPICYDIKKLGKLIGRWPTTFCEGAVPFCRAVCIHAYTVGRLNVLLFSPQRQWAPLQYFLCVVTSGNILFAFVVLPSSPCLHLSLTINHAFYPGLLFLSPYLCFLVVM